MTGLTFNEGLQWLLTVGLVLASTGVTAALLTAWQDRTGAPVSDSSKKYTSYAVPFGLVALAYGAQVAFGYVLFNADTAFAYFLNAGSVAFGSQLVYTTVRKLHAPDPPALPEGK